MKIKVKRYKQIENVAITEAVQKILGEEIDSDRIKSAVVSIQNSGLDPDSIEQILAAISVAANMELGITGE